jgi:hypothetical protein
MKGKNIAGSSGSSQNSNVHDFATVLSLPSRTIFARSPLSCKLCGSTGTLRKFNNEYWCESHFKEIKKYWK